MAFESCNLHGDVYRMKTKTGKNIFGIEVRKHVENGQNVKNVT